jgi:anti-sigma regulatory factor (Ser/Thr protein kinase)
MAGVWRLLLATPEAVPAARHALKEIDEMDVPTRQIVELLVSELVTNAVRHGASDPHESILVRAHRTDGAVRVEVCDEGHGFHERGEAPPELQPSGRGLLLVDRLASRWGVMPGHPNCVWFEAESAPATLH